MGDIHSSCTLAMVDVIFKLYLVLDVRFAWFLTLHIVKCHSNESQNVCLGLASLSVVCEKPGRLTFQSIGQQYPRHKLFLAVISELISHHNFFFC